ncbi:MAG: hypothetical protein GVY16_05025 [Planctomycetes bacterium]|nr:hypothetical protein [Planctomycetota bacterium]
MAESPLLEEQRENWGSRAAFVLAAIGSAVGLGNLWGFPYKLYAYGGGAFLIPYILAMLIIGIPVLILEFSLGHMTQRAAPDAFRRSGRRKQLVGWWGILLGFVIITYYPVILAWCLSFLGRAIEGIIYYNGELPWAKTVDGAKQSFLFDYANMWTGKEGVAGWTLGSLSPEIVFCLAGIWMLLFLCIVKGVNVVSKVVLWTVPLPWLMLVILMVRGLTLPGATQGLAYYMNPDWSQLAQPTTWRFAFGQVFFSMSLAFGVMITYASFLHRKSDINNNAAIIGLGDLGTSFIAGIAIFATVGAMSLAANVPVTKVLPSEDNTTVSMSFIAFPYALAQLPHSAWFALVFFVALLTLGIDSAFSITETVLASIVDKTGWNRTTTLWGLTFVGLTCGLVYTSRGGLVWLEEIDGFVNGPWGIALLGMVECVVLGWMFRIKRLRDHANERSDWKLGVWWDWNLRLLVPVVLSALFAWSLYDTITAYDGYLVTHGGQAIWPVIIGLILAGLAPILAVLLSITRFRPREEEAKITLFDAKPDEATDTTQTRLAFYATLVALVLVAGLGTATIASKLKHNDVVHGVLNPIGKPLKDIANDVKAAAWDRAVEGGLAWGVPEWLMSAGFTVAAALAVLGVIAGVKATLKADTSEKKPHWTGQLAGAFGTLAFGGAGGLLLAFLTMQGAVTKQEVEHTSELNVWAYVIMGVMLAILLLGLGWCFHRAMTAARSDAVEEQTAEL